MGFPNACLDLLIDREQGIWHLTNGEPLTWAALARKACTLTGGDESLVEARPGASFEHIAERPRYSALHSERAVLLPTLDDALERYAAEAAEEDVGEPALYAGR